MKILLIQPKMNNHPMDIDLKTWMPPSLGLLDLASLTPDGHESIIKDTVECTDNSIHTRTSSGVFPKTKNSECIIASP